MTSLPLFCKVINNHRYVALGNALQQMWLKAVVADPDPVLGGDLLVKISTMQHSTLS